jgi:Flp pilus assembly protein CpaB
VLTGLIGIPVFTRGGGIGYVLQPTFGYLLGFIAGAYLIGYFTERIEHPTFWKLLYANLAGLGLIYTIGMVYYYNDPKTTETKNPTQAIVVAIRNISQGQKIVETDITTKEFAIADIPSNAIIETKDVVGKIASEKILNEEIVVKNKLKEKSQWYSDSQRLYNVKFTADTTVGNNVSLYENVDICVLYKAPLPGDKMIDLVLSNKKIYDIRDENGVSISTNSEVKPGYLVFLLNYDEINRIEMAKLEGTLFVGKFANSSVQRPALDTYKKGMTSIIPLATPVPQQ